MPESPRKILFLLGDPEKARNDNHQRLPAAFRDAGWSVTCVDHQQVNIAGNRVRIGSHDPKPYSLIWPLGFGKQASFFDRMQMLKNLPDQQFVVSADALTYLHGKHRWLDHMPETYTSADSTELLDVIQTGGDWVLKPTAGSYGRDVVRISDPDHGRRALADLQSRYPDRHLILQRFLPEILAGEKRTLVAGGRIICSYLRKPRNDFRANLNNEAEALATQLDAGEGQLVTAIAVELARLGAGYAAIDTVYPYLMEVNVANPGGLETLEKLGSRDLASTVVKAVCDWKGLAV